MNEPIILDFFGLPGSGKSTTSHALAEELRKAGMLVFEPSYDIDHNLPSIKRKVYKLLTVAYWGIINPIKTFELLLMVSRAGNSIMVSISLVVNIIIKIAEINKYKSGIIILDQGLVQLVASICQESLCIEKVRLYYNEIFKLLYLGKKYKQVYTSINVDIAIDRAKKRGTLLSRVDRENNLSKKYIIFNFYTMVFAQLLDGSIIVDASKTIHRQVKYIINNI